MQRVMKTMGLGSLALGIAVAVLLLGEVVAANLLVAEHLGSDAAISNWLATSTTALGIFQQHLSNQDWSKLAVVNFLSWLFTEKIYIVALLLIGIVIYYSLRLKTLTPPLVTNQNKLSSSQYEEHKTSNTKRELEKLYNTEAFVKYIQDKRDGKYDNVDETDDEVTQ